MHQRPAYIGRGRGRDRARKKAIFSPWERKKEVGAHLLNTATQIVNRPHSAARKRMGDQQGKYFPLPPPPPAPAHSGTTSIYSVCPRAPPLSAGKSDRGEKEREIVSALSTYIPPFFVGGAWVFSPERRGRERERERSRRRGRKRQQSPPLARRDRRGDKEEEEGKIDQSIYIPVECITSYLPTKRRIFTTQGQDKR